MADTKLQELILQGDLIVRVHDAAPPYSPFKLPAALDGFFRTGLGAARAANSALQLAAGDQAGARGRVQQARDRLAGLVRNAFNHVNSVPDEDASEQDRLDALVSLGFEQGELGPVAADPAHVLGIVTAILENNGEVPVLLRMPANITTRLTNWQAVLAANEGIANGGSRGVLTDAKDTARDTLAARISRVRHWLCSCSDEGEQNPELARWGFQPKRAPGDAQPQPKPAAAGPVTWDPATRTLTVAALPDHATRLVAWRKIAGGTPEPSGMSDTESVDAAETAPFVPGSTYELWVTGRNSAGDGPASNKITWTAPV
jgi:hypothetical protein